MATSRAICRSAAWAFAQTFLPPPPGSVRRRVGTNNLPVELLVVIFKLAFEQQLERGMGHSWYDFDALSPSLFPYALAAVCSLWRDVLSLVPEYWTRVVLFVDSEVPCPDAMSSQLSWSRGLRLDHVVVVGRAVDAQGTIMSKVMKTHINPNLCRTQTLRFNVQSSSSLPSFPVHFDHATQLRRLTLACVEDDGGRDEFDSDASMTPTSTEPQFPVLDVLTIDGRNYFNACKRDDVGWPGAVKNVYNFTVSRYTPRPGESFSTHDFLLPLKDMNRFGLLHIVDIDLCPSEPHINATPSQVFKHFKHIYLHDMARFDSVSEVLNLTSSIDLTMVKCALGQPLRHFHVGATGYLSLYDIDETEDMAVFLNIWEGGRLFVTRCPGFNDRVLDLLSMNTSTYHLVIEDCPNFSVEALKRMVSGLVYKNGNRRRLELLRVSGRLPPFSDATIGWFRENVDRFAS